MEEPETEPTAATAAELRDRIADRQDMLAARAHAPAGRKPWYKSMGPGLITGAADADPSAIGTYSVAGAQFGYQLAWTLPVMIPMMIAIQEMCGRIGVVTGRGLASALREHYAKWVVWGAILLLVVANVMNIFADLNVMAATIRLLLPGSLRLWITCFAVGIAAVQILVPYRQYVRVLKWTCLALLGYVVAALWPSVHHDWGAVAHALFVPSWRAGTPYMLAVVGALGTSISPYLFFWQSSEEVEEEIVAGKVAGPGRRIVSASDVELQSLRADTAVGMVASQAIVFFILLCSAAMLHAKGQTDVNSAEDAARALRPLGSAATAIFVAGIMSSGLLAIPALAGSTAYAVAEAAGWPYGLYRRLRRAPRFYGVIAAAIFAGYVLCFTGTISPLKGLLYSAVLNGIVAPPLIVLLLLLCNNRKVLGDRCNGPISNALAVIAAGAMALASAVLIWAFATGKAS